MTRRRRPGARGWREAAGALPGAGHLLGKVGGHSGAALAAGTKQSRCLARWSRRDIAPRSACLHRDSVLIIVLFG